MILAIDIGNTNIVLSTFDTDWNEGLRVRTHSLNNLQLIEKYLTNTFFERCVISSVVPKLTGSIQKLVIKVKRIEPIVVSNKINTTLLNSSIPDECGSDLICNAAAGHSLYPDKNVVIADYGTAFTTITVSPKGEILGVTIGPGLVTSLKALSLNTAQIPRIMISVPDTVLGRNTEDAVKAGVVFGFAGQLNAIVSRIENELDDKVAVIVTGGFSNYVSPLLEKVDYSDINLTLDGARLILENN